jgi:hypothetical protein
MLSTIKLAIKPLQFFQTSQVANTDIAVSYDQQQQVSMPKILNHVNAVPTRFGIKSSSNYSAAISSIIEDENAASTLLDLGPSTELTTMIDRTGNVWYMILDRNANSTSTDIYLRSSATGDAFAKYATIASANRYEFTIASVFQNRTLFAALPTTTFHVPVTTIPHPDALAVPVPGQFFDVDLVTGEIIAYDLLGIGTSVLASTQCVTSYQNYMLLFTRNRLYYSCPTDPYDFTPTDNGGGSTAIAEVRGDILAVLPSASGFIIYCRDNIVLGRFTGSTAQPFTFSEIKGSTGLLMRGDEPLIVRDETSEAHYALLVSGLSVITENEVRPVPEGLRRFATADYTEARTVNTCKIRQVPTTLGNPPQISKIKRLYSYGNRLFMLIEGGLLYSYDLVDDSIGIVNGDYRALCPTLSQANATADLFLQRKVSATADAYTLLRVLATDPVTYSFEVLDYGSISNAPVLTGSGVNLTSEVVVGDISISPDRNTILESVKLVGRLTRLVAGDVGYDSAETDRVRVFGYSSSYNVNSLLEFEYNPADNKYYGWMEGPDVRILIQGDYFYLNGIEARVGEGMYIL